ncbi:hypothetical protein VTK73DRAFT_179 [Phialemonium thermophilum]|uniref:Uncharacterized protein n=1 Tax=Phialemonium thermophilum TaxID=223376 RepID=A0ABR3VWG2_9PEZI
MWCGRRCGYHALSEGEFVLKDVRRRELFHDGPSGGGMGWNDSQRDSCRVRRSKSFPAAGLPRASSLSRLADCRARRIPFPTERFHERAMTRRRGLIRQIVQKDRYASRGNHCRSSPAKTRVFEIWDRGCNEQSGLVLSLKSAWPVVTGRCRIERGQLWECLFIRKRNTVSSHVRP